MSSLPSAPPPPLPSSKTPSRTPSPSSSSSPPTLPTAPSVVPSAGTTSARTTTATVPPTLPPLYASLLKPLGAPPSDPETAPETDPAADADVQRRFDAIMRDRYAAKEARDPTLKTLPRFYFARRAKPDESLDSQVKRVANRLHLHKLSMQQLQDSDLKQIAVSLQSHVSPPADGTDRINYDGFCTVRDHVREHVSPAAAQFFTAKTFLKFPHDEHDRISSKSLFQYICGNVGLSQTRIHLSSYDSVGDGHLREFDLENYVFELIPMLPPLRSLKENFIPFYVFTAVRKFLFFLDPKKMGRIPINHLVGSKAMAELQALRSENWSEASNQQNWFSASNALRVYSQYLELDTDMNGMLNKDEVLHYGSGSLVSVFVERVFQECLTYGGEMDFKTFLEFMLAMENRKTLASMHFLFRLLDIRRQGFLDTFTINYFFREITRRLAAAGHEPVDPADVKDEIFDMVSPADPLRITLEDLRRCKVGHTVLYMLIDVNGFWQYDNRESLMQQKDAEDADEC